MKPEVGTIYSDPSGDYEILAINKNGVTVKKRRHWRCLGRC